MNKPLTFLLLSLIIVFSSCQKNEYIVPNRTIVTQINGVDWRSNDGGRTFVTRIDMPEIDNYFNENGAAIVFVSFGTVEYEQIPQVFDGVSYRYTTRPGEIAITIENATGEGIVKAPRGPMDVKIILIDSQ